MNGRNPTLLIGYSAYGITITPTFGLDELAWFKGGGIIAIAHVRDGGWYNEDWYKVGMKLT